MRNTMTSKQQVVKQRLQDDIRNKLEAVLLKSTRMRELKLNEKENSNDQEML